MNIQVQANFRTAERRLPFECVALVLQGGGALGAYQAGVYEALAEAEHRSRLGRRRLDRRHQLSHHRGKRAGRAGRQAAHILAGDHRQPAARLGAGPPSITPKGDLARDALQPGECDLRLVGGRRRAFSSLRQPAPWLHPDGALEATSFYETKHLKSTLERLVDFDRINAGEMRFSVGAVNVRTGNFVYFDNTTHTIRPEHVMASGSLPPGFPAVEIDGEFYWDGGLISNTPLQWVVEQGPRQDTLAFQVDLWSAHGEVPGNLAEVATRQKEIQYSSRTRANTDQFKRVAAPAQCARKPPVEAAGRPARPARRRSC